MMNTPVLKIVDSHGQPIPKAMAYPGLFEGATTGRRMSNWGMSTVGPNTALYSNLASLRSRTRELERNNSLAGGGVDSIVSNMIGTGIKPRWQIDNQKLKEKIQELWNDSINEMDADAVSSFYGLQALVARTMITGGEALARFVPRRISPRFAVPIQIQIMEGDLLDETFSTIANNGNEILMGIEFDPGMRRKAYHLFKHHPGEMFLTRDNTSRVRIPEHQVMHIYRPLRAGQLRGLPWFSRIILKLHEIDQCVDAELVRRKTTAMFGGFITNLMEQPGTHSLLGLTQPNNDAGQVVAIEPGTFPTLPVGTDVKFSRPVDVSGNYVAWMVSQLRDIARGMGLTYEQLTGDLTGVNYSSIRAGLLEFRRLITQIQAHTIVFQFCRPAINRWMDTAVLSGAIQIPDYLTNRRKYQRVEWIPDAWDWVDPLKEIKADIMEIRGGLTSRRRKIAQRTGADIETIDKEIVQDNARADKLGMVLDSDSKKTTPSGIAHKTQSKTNGTEKGETPEEKQSTQNIPEDIKSQAETYGVLVRAGAVTPQNDEENQDNNEDETDE